MQIVSRVRPATDPVQIRRTRTDTADRDNLATVPCFGMELLERRVLYAAGDLDPGFDGDGWTSTTHRDGAGWPTGIHYVTDLLVQPDGRTVVLGQAHSYRKIGLYRYNVDGSLDATFGDGGRVLTDVSPNNEHGDALTLLPDGKYLVAGSSQAQHGGTAFTILRYHADGSLDTTFGDSNSGVVVRDFGMLHSDGNALVVGADGTITVAGSALHESGTQDVMLVRLTPHGTLDDSFGNGGVMMADFGGADRAADLRLGSDGSLMVLVRSHIEAQQSEPSYVARFNLDGSVDATFGAGGRVLVDFGNGYEGTTTRDLILLADGQFLVGGGVHQGFGREYAPHLAAGRYNADGSLDATFGNGGVAIVSGNDGDLLVGNSYMAVRADGSIVLAGGRRLLEYSSTDPAHGDLVVALLDSDGHLDPTFGDSGITTNDLGGQEGVWALAVTPNGNIVVAANNEEHDVILARYDGGLGAEPAIAAPPAADAPVADAPVADPQAPPSSPLQPSFDEPPSARMADRLFTLSDKTVAHSAFSLLSAASSDLLDGETDEDELLAI